MTATEKDAYGSNVAADVDRILKVIDDDLEALKAEKIRSAMGEIGNHDLGRKLSAIAFL